jgi:hypothetical protein
MDEIKGNVKNTPPEGTNWEAELKKVGFLRRLLMGRKWYGADWWFVAISGVMVLGFIIVAIFPQWFAPYSPEKLVGPRFLAPNEEAALSVLIVPVDSTVNELKDLAALKAQHAR